MSFGINFNGRCDPRELKDVQAIHNDLMETVRQIDPNATIKFEPGPQFMSSATGHSAQAHNDIIGAAWLKAATGFRKVDPGLVGTFYSYDQSGSVKGDVRDLPPLRKPARRRLAKKTVPVKKSAIAKKAPAKRKAAAPKKASTRKKK